MQRRIAHAFSDAEDFANIINALPPDRSEQILRELKAATKGTPDDPRLRQASYRFQSQYWMGSVLEGGGYRPRIPIGAGTKSPDFIVEEGTYRYGIEIKRPSGLSAALRLTSQAAVQLREYGVAGCVVLDLSECVPSDQLHWLENGDASEAQQRFMEEMARVFASIRSSILDDDRHEMRPGFQGVMGFAGIARGWSWIGPDPKRLALHAAFGATAFVRLIKDVRYHHSINMMDRITDGLRSVGHEFQPFRTVADFLK